MINTIVIILLTILLVFSIAFIFWLIYSKRRKTIINSFKKEAKIERKAIIANGYREINDLKMNLQTEREKYLNEIDLEKNKLEGERALFDKQLALLEIKQQRLDAYELSLEKRSKDYDEKMSSIISTLENISGISKKEAKDELIKKVEYKTKKEMNSYIKNAELEAYNKAKELTNNILINSMEKYSTKIVNEKTTNIIKLPNEELKGRIIGKDGRNIKAFEQFGGVDIIIDDTPETVIISSFNPIRREIATKTLEKLLVDGRIQPAKIESELKYQEKELDTLMLEEGYKVVQELDITNIDVNLVKLIGKLKYRTSYGQNVLLHSIEVAKIAGSIAAELDLNVRDAIRGGLLHDIGKAVDFEQEGSHVTLGAKIAKKFGENDVVINAIEAHHEDVPKNSFIAAIVSIADSISAARPGARNNTLDDFYKRMNEIESICNKIPGVDKTYALQSGRQIRVIVDPIAINDSQMLDTIETIKDQIQKNVIIPGEITITLIREKREVKIIK